MKTKLFSSLLIGMAAASGCTSVHRGVVAMKISDTSAHVCLNKDEVEVGDSVKIYRNVCNPSPSKPPIGKCQKRLLGNGKVTELLNDHYSVVSVPTGTDFKEGDFVER